MTRGRISELKPGGGGQRQRAAYYEDYAKPVLVNWPFMLVAAATLFIVGHFANRGSGRRVGGDSKKRSPSTEGSIDRSKSSNGREEGSLGHWGNQPASLAELRTLRAEAAEARLTHGAATSSGPGASKLTPLGAILRLARKVDKYEEEVSRFLETVKDSDKLNSKQDKDAVELWTSNAEVDYFNLDNSMDPRWREAMQNLANAAWGFKIAGAPDPSPIRD